MQTAVTFTLRANCRLRSPRKEWSRYVASYPLTLVTGVQDCCAFVRATFLRRLSCTDQCLGLQAWKSPAASLPGPQHPTAERWTRSCDSPCCYTAREQNRAHQLLLSGHDTRNTRHAFCHPVCTPRYVQAGFHDKNVSTGSESKIHQLLSATLSYCPQLKQALVSSRLAWPSLPVLALTCT